MAFKFKCADTGMKCDFEAMADTKEQLLRKALAHAKAAHSMAEKSKEKLANVRPLMKIDAWEKLDTKTKEAFLRATELFVIGEVLPCISSPLRMEMIQSLESFLSRRGRFGDVTGAALAQHLDLLRKAALVTEDPEVRKGPLAHVFDRFAHFSDVLAAFHERRSSLKRFDILSRLVLARRDRFEGVSLSLLAKHCGLSDSTLFKHLKQLQEAGAVTDSGEQEWGSPYAVSEKGGEFVRLVSDSIEETALLTIDAVTKLGTPRKVIFPARGDRAHLVSFDGRRITLETPETLSSVLRYATPLGLAERAMEAGALSELFKEVVLQKETDQKRIMA
jgi:predicted small metal-binding protein/DNA-binding transcriptional ArsR family regulator